MVAYPSENGEQKGRGKAPGSRKTQIKPGQVLNPKGRPKGSRNKLGQQFIDALQADFEQHGEQVIQEVRAERPHEYLKIIASLLPKDINVNTNSVNELSDEQLAELIEALQRGLPAFIADNARERTETSARH